MQKVLVILGPTATGKSELAVNIAKKLNGEIISADSRQVYKNLDIGTGKITKKEMRGIKHYLIDVIDPRCRFSVSQFQKLANKEINQILKRGKLPIICGGTGFYIDAITQGIILPQVKPNLKLRKELMKQDPTSLLKILKKIDKTRVKTIDPYNKVRIIRAIEIAQTLGKVPKLNTQKPKYEFIKIGITCPSTFYNQKIEKRVKKMFKDGLLQEIKKLKKSGVSEKRLKEFGFEYNNPNIDTVISGTKKYAKRQMTWFKRDKDTKWFEISNSADFKLIFSFLEKVERVRLLPHQ